MGATSPHFSDSELSCHGMASTPPCGCGGVNECQQELVDALEALRKVGLPIAVDDAYRCPVHNAAVGGAPNSEHMRGIAADIKITGMTAAEMYQAALNIPAFANGGIGVAEHQGYIHVDTRGVSARWCYDVKGKTIPFDKSLAELSV